MKGMCDGKVKGRFTCSNPAAFVFVNDEDQYEASRERYGDDGYLREVCGLHLASEINRYPIPSPQGTRFTVVPHNPNIDRILAAERQPQPLMVGRNKREIQQ